MPSLFRPEALDGQRQDWLGSIQLLRPVSLAVLTLWVVFVLAGVLTFLGVGEYTRRMTVAGVLAPDRGVLRVLAQQAGTIVESHVVEGQAVQRGDLLFVLAVGQSSDQGDTQTAVADSLGVRERSLYDAARQNETLLESQRTDIARQNSDLGLELKQLEAEQALLTQRLALTQAALARLESLKSDNFISQAQVQAKAEELLAVKEQQQALARQRLGKQRELNKLEALLRELPLRAKVRQGEISRDLAELAQAAAENASRRHMVVRAPQAGIVSGITAQVGQPTDPEVALASLLPADAQLQAQLYAPSSAVGFLRRNQTVRLRYQAFPFQKFGHQSGHVVQVSRAPLQPSELTGVSLRLPGGATMPTGEPLYRITVALDAQTVQAYGEPHALAPGMQLDADVMLDRRRLIEWIFEPLISISGQV